MPETKLKKEVTVTQAMLAQKVGSGSLPVLATPVLAALFEESAAQLAAAYLPAGITTVGTEIVLRHNAPTPCGARLTVETELTGRGERDFHFRFSASDETGPVAEGEHTRFSVKAEKFVKKAEARKVKP